MAAQPLESFAVYNKRHFTIGGDPEALGNSIDRRHAIAADCHRYDDLFGTANFADCAGAVADSYRFHADATLACAVDHCRSVHKDVAKVLEEYAWGLNESNHRMDEVRDRGRISHGRYQDQVEVVNRAENAYRRTGSEADWFTWQKEREFLWECDRDFTFQTNEGENIKGMLIGIIEGLVMDVLRIDLPVYRLDFAVLEPLHSGFSINGPEIDRSCRVLDDIAAGVRATVDKIVATGGVDDVFGRVLADAIELLDQEWKLYLLAVADSTDKLAASARRYKREVHSADEANSFELTGLNVPYERPDRAAYLGLQAEDIQSTVATTGVTLPFSLAGSFADTVGGLAGASAVSGYLAQGVGAGMGMAAAVDEGYSVETARKAMVRGETAGLIVGGAVEFAVDKAAKFPGDRYVADLAGEFAGGATSLIVSETVKRVSGEALPDR